MKTTFAIVLSSCFLAAALALLEPCIEQSECGAGQCCAGFPPMGGSCRNLTLEGEKCRVVDKVVPIFGGYYMGTICNCAEGLVCVQQGKKKNDGICQVPPTTAAPTEAPVDDGSNSGASDEASDSGASDQGSDSGASAEAAPAEAAPAEAAPAEAAPVEAAPEAAPAEAAPEAAPAEE